MKRKYLLSVAAGATFLVVAFWVGTVYATAATASCFSDIVGNPAAGAICWMKQNGLASGKLFRPKDPTTRAQAAVWLQKVSQIPPTTGQILISDGFGNWRPFNSTDNLSFTNFSGSTYFYKATTGTNYLSLQPSIPTVFYGRSLQLLGVEFCYTASTNVHFSYVEINTYTHTTGPGTRDLRFSDNTDRTDTACRYYVLPAPVKLTAEDGVNIFIQGNWSLANAPLILGRTTFVFAPTDSKALAPSGANVVTLQENGPQPADGGSTAGPQE
jgi:hypothetical protein